MIFDLVIDEAGILLTVTTFTLVFGFFGSRIAPL